MTRGLTLPFTIVDFWGQIAYWLPMAWRRPNLRRHPEPLHLRHRLAALQLQPPQSLTQQPAAAGSGSHHRAVQQRGQLEELPLALILPWSWRTRRFSSPTACGRQGKCWLLRWPGDGKGGGVISRLSARGEAAPVPVDVGAQYPFSHLSVVLKRNLLPLNSMQDFNPQVFTQVMGNPCVQKANE